VSARPEPVEIGPDDRAAAVPPAVLRQWSDALAAAGLFAEAFTVHPAAERADLVRRAELAVLRGDHDTALWMLGDLTATPARPWLELLTHAAAVQAGDGAQLPAVLAATVQPSAGVSWVTALAAAAAGDLPAAAPAATAARAGGCRDLRMLVILAADRAADGDDWTALDLADQAQRTALPDETPARQVVELLVRSGRQDDAARLAVLGAGERSRPGRLRSEWLGAARLVGVGHRRALRRSLTAVAAAAAGTRERQERRRRQELLRDLTCRCYGSAGWIGPERLHYVDHHLVGVLPAPVAGLPARLLRCPATRLTLLDLVERQLTLPVVSQVAPGRAPDPRARLGERPTPGMGVSLGRALPTPAPWSTEYLEPDPAEGEEPRRRRAGRRGGRRGGHREVTGPADPAPVVPDDREGRPGAVPEPGPKHPKASSTAGG
jgi:hypothetical protein